MKKLASLVLAVVLMASMFALLGTVTVSAETYELNKELVNLTFDGDAPYGIPAGRYATRDYENGYLKVYNGAGNNGGSYIGINGNVGETLIQQTAGASDKEAAYNNLFKFKAGKTYRLSFDYKFLAGSGCNPGESRQMIMHVNTNPLVAADAKRELPTRTTVIDSQPAGFSIAAGESSTLANDTEWASAYYVFTVKEEDTAGVCIGICPGYADVKTGYISSAYVDNIKIEEILGSYTYTDTGVYTMDNNEVATMSGATVSYETDPEKGNVVKVVGSNGGRAYIPGTPNIKANTKYYVSFEAKGIEAGNFMNFGVGRVDTPGGCRMFFMGYNDIARGTKTFINDVETIVTDKSTQDISDDTPNVSTEWQTYGIIIDTSSKDFLAAMVNGQKVLEETTYVFFGAQYSTIYFDNVKIVEVGKIDGAVPEADASAKYSIRKEAAGVSAGIRFKGDVAASVKATANEIGFVVVPAEVVYGEADWYKFGSLNKSAKTVVAYNGTKDVVYEDKGDAVSYQLILTNLGNLVDRRFAAVMYVKTGDTYEYISLGEISYNQVVAEYAIRGN